MGVVVSEGSGVSINGPVRLTGQGVPQSWGRGLSVTASVLTVGGLAQPGDVEIAGYSDGIWLSDNATAYIASVELSENGNGLMVDGSSVARISGQNTIQSYWQDLYCDAHSLVTGTSALEGLTTVSCPNANP